MTTITASAALIPVAPVFSEPERLALAGFLASYAGLTREAYTLDFRQFTGCCQQRHVSLFTARRAGEHLADLRRIDATLAEIKKKLAVAVKASDTSLTQVFGVGPVIAATVTGDVADVTRFPTASKFASYNGTAPIEVSSGNRKKDLPAVHAR